MKSIILIGEKEERNLYTDKYIKENGVKNYNVVKFENRIKIADVREIKKIVSMKQSEKRLFLLCSDITTEAQNAFLKILEELPAQTDVIFVSESKESFLPTIISRSFIINLQIDAEFEDFEGYEKEILELVNSLGDEKKTLFLSLLLSEKLTSNKEENQFKKIIMCLRRIILKVAKNEIGLEKKKVMHVFNLIEKFNYYYPYVFSNNMNKRMVVDNILFESILKIS